MNEKFHNALKNIPQDVPPIWFMRQAGRYHSHYQNLRKKHTFEELCKNPNLAAEVACGPIRDFDYDLQKACRGDNFKSTYRQTKDCACLNGCNLLTSLNHHLNFSAELPSQ